MTGKTNYRQSTGKAGEEIAARYLQHHYGLVPHVFNWRYSRYGEMDLICISAEQKLLVFVEVKTRRNEAFGSPEEAVGYRKQQQMLKIGQAYLQQHPQFAEYSIRFDVVGILFPPNHQPAQITHFSDVVQTG